VLAKLIHVPELFISPRKNKDVLPTQKTEGKTKELLNCGKILKRVSGQITVLPARKVFSTVLPVT